MNMWRGGAALALILAPASAQAQAPQTPPLLSAVTACRDVTDDAARLRCYDAATAALARAASNGEIVVVNREDVRRTRRSLFGFNVPRLPFFSGDSSQDEEPREIESAIKTARAVDYGKWLVELENGQVWQTTEPVGRQPPPRSGQPVKVRKAALGSYMLAVEGRRTIRAMRLR